MACIYLEVVGGSVMVALLNLAVPTVQIICTLVSKQQIRGLWHHQLRECDPAGMDLRLY